MQDDSVLMFPEFYHLCIQFCLFLCKGFALHRGWGFSPWLPGCCSASLSSSWHGSGFPPFFGMSLRVCLSLETSSSSVAHTAHIGWSCMHFSDHGLHEHSCGGSCALACTHSWSPCGPCWGPGHGVVQSHGCCLSIFLTMSIVCQHLDVLSNVFTCLFDLSHLMVKEG